MPRDFRRNNGGWSVDPAGPDGLAYTHSQTTYTPTNYGRADDWLDDFLAGQGLPDPTDTEWGQDEEIVGDGSGNPAIAENRAYHPRGHYSGNRRGLSEAEARAAGDPNPDPIPQSGSGSAPSWGSEPWHWPTAVGGALLVAVLIFRR